MNVPPLKDYVKMGGLVEIHLLEHSLATALMILPEKRVMSPPFRATLTPALIMEHANYKDARSCVHAQWDSLGQYVMSISMTASLTLAKTMPHAMTT